MCLIKLFTLEKFRNYACDDDNFKFPILLGLEDAKICCLLVAQYEFNNCRPEIEMYV